MIHFVDAFLYCYIRVVSMSYILVRHRLRLALISISRRLKSLYWTGKKDTPSGCFYFWRVNCSEQCSWRHALCCRHNQRLLHSAHALGGMPGKNSAGNGLQRFLDQVLQTARIDNMRLLEIHFLLQLLHVLELTCMHKGKGLRV